MKEKNSCPHTLPNKILLNLSSFLRNGAFVASPSINYLTTHSAFQSHLCLSAWWDGASRLRVQCHINRL